MLTLPAAARPGRERLLPRRHRVQHGVRRGAVRARHPRDPDRHLADPALECPVLRRDRGDDPGPHRLLSAVQALLAGLRSVVPPPASRGFRGSRGAGIRARLTWGAGGGLARDGYRPSRLDRPRVESVDHLELLARLGQRETDEVRSRGLELSADRIELLCRQTETPVADQDLEVAEARAQPLAEVP